MMDTLTDELRSYLIQALYDEDAATRKRSHWVMNDEWFLEVRKLTDQMGHPLYLPPVSVTGPEILLGLPVEIKADGGAPHLELNP
jgi:HK97 family phage major capsid protein